MHEAGAGAKGIFFYTFDRIGNDNAGKGCAAVKRPSFYRGHTVGDDNTA